jgi:hypothetical protein
MSSEIFGRVHRRLLKSGLRAAAEARGGADSPVEFILL